MANNEYEKISKEMEYNLSARHSFLTFSFTSVIAILGFAFSDIIENEWLYLFPFFLIIPFNARIVYLRQSHAHSNAFLSVFYEKDSIFGEASKYCIIRRNKFDIIIELLVNFEMFFLSICCTFLFYSKYLINYKEFNIIDWLKSLIPIFLSAIVAIMISSTFNYGKMCRDYIEKWKIAKEKIIAKEKKHKKGD